MTPPPPAGSGVGESSSPRGVRVAIMQPPPPPPLAGPARQGGVPSSPRLPALAPAPLPFFSSSRTWESPGSPGSPWLRARNSAAGKGWARDAPGAACSCRPRPTRSPAYFPRRRPTSPGGRPRAGRRRRARRDALCSRPCGRRSRRARRGRSGAGGGGGRRGSPPSPSRRRSAAPRPRAHRPLALELEPNFSSFLFLSNGAGNSCSAPAGGNALALPRAQTRSLLSPVPPHAGSTTKSHLHARK